MKCGEKNLRLYAVTDRSWLKDSALETRWKKPCWGEPPLCS